MSNRSFFTYKGQEANDVGFYERALSNLSKHHVNKFTLEEAQMYAWERELDVLDDVAKAFPSCTIALEYMIPRMGKRVDAVILINNFIFVVEFKVGEKKYPREAIDQVADYAFDLKNFHGDSHNRALFPVSVVILNANCGGKRTVCSYPCKNGGVSLRLGLQFREAPGIPAGIRPISGMLARGPGPFLAELNAKPMSLLLHSVGEQRGP